jgi:hypothetical protein
MIVMLSVSVLHAGCFRHTEFYDFCSDEQYRIMNLQELHAGSFRPAFWVMVLLTHISWRFGKVRKVKRLR